MGTALSVRWHQVAERQPRLVPQLRVRRQRHRGEPWVLLCHPHSGRSVRLSPAAWQWAGRLDGARTLQQLWDHAGADADGEPPTQDEVIEMLAQLRSAGLLQPSSGGDGFEAASMASDAGDDTLSATRGRSTLLAWRLPLGDPSAALDRVERLAPRLFNTRAFVVWLLAVACLAVLAALHASELWAHGRQWIATPRYALLAALLYVPLKALHELAHALAVRRWGGDVHEAGVTLMFGMPVPYVDASAATAFTSRRRRVLVGAAGMMAELAVASVALPLWLWLDDGLARDAAFVTLFLTGLSTLLFNANPLQRLDGYFILTDLADLPNLATRSRRWWVGWLRRRLLALPDEEAMGTARGETPWLVAYAPLSWAVTLAIAATAVFWLGALSSALGLVAGALLAWQVGLRPVHALLGPVRRAALARPEAAARWRRLRLAALLALAGLLALPLPQRQLAQGVVWPPEQAQLRADEEGFVQAVLAADGEPVQAGTPVLSLSSPRLRADLARQASRVEALESELFGALPGTDRASATGRAGDAQLALDAARLALQRLQDRERALVVRARSAGQLALPHAADLPGAYIARGRLLGQVRTDAPTTVRVALPESEARSLTRAPAQVSVVLASSPGVVRHATLRRDSLGAVARLPSAALARRHGGDIATDPADAEGLTPLDPVVLLDVELAPGAMQDRRLGERAQVRFDTGLAPLAVQALGTLREHLGRAFHPSR